MTIFSATSPLVAVSLAEDTEYLEGLDALADADKIFFAEAMILWLYELRKREGGRERFKQALIIEEGHRVLSHNMLNSGALSGTLTQCLPAAMRQE